MYYTRLALQLFIELSNIYINDAAKHKSLFLRYPTLSKEYINDIESGIEDLIIREDIDYSVFEEYGR